MSYMKDGLLLAAGGAIGLIAGVMLCDTLNDEDTAEPNSARTSEESNLAAVVEKVRQEALVAMERCETAEERAAVYADCQESIGKMQTLLTQHGEAMLRDVKERAELSAEVTQEVSVARSKHIKTTIDGLTEELDNILRDIAPKNEVCVGG